MDTSPNKSLAPAARKDENKRKLDGAEFLRMLESAEVSKYINERFRREVDNNIPSETPVQKVLSPQEPATAIPWISPYHGHEQDLVTPFSWLVLNTEQQPPHQGTHTFFLGETLPWPPRVVIECLQRTFGPYNFKLYHKPNRSRETSGQYFVEILELPLDFDPLLCIVGPEFRAGHKGEGFYARLEPISGFCRYCRMQHEGRSCKDAELVHTDRIISASLDRDLLPHYQIPPFALVNSLLD